MRQFRNRLLSTATSVLGLISLGLPMEAHAQGPIQIDQAAALAGGVTPGDEPGFPVTLSEPGSYLLVGNLDLTTICPATIHGIEVTDHNVSIDMAGFEIKGCVTCQGHNCTDVGTPPPAGIYSTQSDVTVSNGIVQRMGIGIQLDDNGHAINVRSLFNSDGGIYVGKGGLIRNSLADGNNGVGMTVGGPGGWVSGNVAKSNQIGMEIDDYATVANNTVYKSEEGGLTAGAGAVCTGNTVADNGGVGILAGAGSIVSGNASSANQVGIWAKDGALVQGNTVYGNTETGVKTEGVPGYAANVISGSTTALERESGKGGKRLGPNLCLGRKRCRYSR